MTKIHADTACRPVAILLTGGQVADRTAADRLLDQLTTANLVHGDKGYDSNAVRRKIGLPPTYRPRSIAVERPASRPTSTAAGTLRPSVNRPGLVCRWSQDGVMSNLAKGKFSPEVHARAEQMVPISSDCFSPYAVRDAPATVHLRRPWNMSSPSREAPA